MSSGGKGGRGNKNSRHGGDKQNSSNTQHKDTSDTHKSELLTTDKDKETLPHKIAPTAEQLRLAQMIGNTKTEPDRVLQEKLNKVMQFTGVSSDEALVALHDCDNDVNTAVDNLLEGDFKGQWLASTKKKKKAPANKVVETESNKENRKADNRERSGSRQRGGGPPRFRGRGGGRGGKDGDGDGPGRGEGSRRGRMANGGPLSRGRGGRGRGSGPGSRTFQNRQPPGFPDSIDTWGPTEPQDQQNSLKIDTWDEEPAPTNEDWDDEWTGSLDQTTVFGPSSTGSSSMPPVEEHLTDQLLVTNQDPSSSTSQQTFPPPTQSASLTQPSQLELMALLQKAAPHSTLTGLGTASQLSGNTGGLGSGSSVGPLGSSGVGSLVNNGVGSLGNGSGVGTLGNGNGVGGLGTTSGIGPLGSNSGVGSLGSIGSSNGVGALCSNSLGATGNNGMGSSGQHSILSSLSNSMGEALKSSGLVNTVGGTGSSVSTSVPAPYTSPTSPMQNSMFSNPGLHSVSSSLSNSINSSSSNSGVMNKSVTMPGAPTSVPVLASRQKPQRSRITQSSKIPLSAVEMPEDAMATLDMQFTGLEFGAETFDLNSEIKVSQSSNTNNSMQTTVAASTHSVGHIASHSVASTVTKDLSSVTSLPPSLAQSSKLGPDPISYPTSQTNDRKSTSSAFVTTGQRSSSGSSSSQGLADLSKKENTSSGLGSLMGTPSAPNPYQSYSSKTSTSFPSPPSASYVPPPSHQMSSYSSSQSGSSSGYNSSSVVGNNSNSSSNNAVVSSTQNSANVYGQSFSAQVSTGTGSNQYQNNYVNSSSHSSLASMSTPKTLSSLKESSQSYSEASTGVASGLSSTLVTSVTGTSVSAGSSTGANSGLSTALNTASHHSQSSKPLSAKTVNVNNSVGSNMQSSVQSHQATHIQTHHQQHQQQQQQQQAQQLLAQPSQYVSPQPAIQGGLAPYYNLQQPAMYSFEDLQLIQQRMPHMQQTPTTMTTGREGNIPSAAYTVADNKFRTDQNSSPVPSSINQQGATAGGTYITATGNAALPPFYMYHNVAAVPSSFPQYGAPAIIQLPPNTHTGSNTTQFPGGPKLPYASTNYYDTVSQNPDFKSGYNTASQGQSKTGSGNTGSASNSANDLGPYKNHLSKTYDKQGFHGTPPPYNMAGSGTNPMTPNAYAPMFISTLPTGQHHSPMMHHHPLHQDGGSTGGQRTGNSNSQSKSGNKPYSTPSYWGSN